MRIDGLLFLVAVFLLLLAAFGVSDNEVRLAYIGIACGFAGLAAMVFGPKRVG